MPPTNVPHLSQFAKMYEIYGLLFGILVTLIKPDHFAIIVNLIGIHKTTFFVEEGLKSVSQEIEKVVIDSNPGAFDSFLTLSAQGKHNSDGGPLYTLDNNIFLRWYCKCHGLDRLSFSVCREEGSGILCLIYHRERTHSFQQGLVNPASWQIIGAYSPRTAFVESMNKSHRGVSYIQIYKPHGSLRRKAIPWKGALSIPVCAADAVVLKGGLRDAVTKRIDRLIKTGPRCLEVGVRPQLGMLFLGPKGTGKSSFIHILARVYGFPIYDFDIGDPTLEDTDLIAMCDAMEPNSIAVFDDIDRVGVGGRGITEAALLKVFDGNKTRTQGRLVIATANDRKKVPEALLRKGRIDEEYLFSEASQAQLKDLFLRTHIWLKEETKGHDLNMLAEEFSLKVSSDIYSPAAITSYLKGVAGPKEAIANIADIGVTVN